MSILLFQIAKWIVKVWQSFLHGGKSAAQVSQMVKVNNFFNGFLSECFKKNLLQTVENSV